MRGPVELGPVCRSSSPLWAKLRAESRSSFMIGAVDITEGAAGARTASVAKACSTAGTAITEADGAVKPSRHADCPGPPSSSSASPEAPGSTCCSAAATSAALELPVSALLRAPVEFCKTKAASGPAPVSVRPSVFNQTKTWAGCALVVKKSLAGRRWSGCAWRPSHAESPKRTSLVPFPATAMAKTAFPWEATTSGATLRTAPVPFTPAGLSTAARRHGIGEHGAYRGCHAVGGSQPPAPVTTPQWR